MCGIVVVKRLDGQGAAKSVLKRYHAQKFRGTDGYGYLAIEGDVVKDFVRMRTELEIKEMLATETAPFVIFHHRYPTSVMNVAEAAHPICVSHDSLKSDYYVIHNGVVSNDSARKKAHEALGFVYSTEVRTVQVTQKGEVWPKDSEWNDSEALAIDLALAIDSGADTIETKGSAAVVVAEVEKGTQKLLRLHYARNTGSPLNIHSDKHIWQLTSTGKGELVDPHTLFTLDYVTNEISSRPFALPWYTNPTYPVRGSTSALDEMGFRLPAGRHISTDLEDWEERNQAKATLKVEPGAMTETEPDIAHYASEHIRLTEEIEILETMQEDARTEKKWTEYIDIGKEIGELKDELFYVEQATDYYGG